MDTTVSINPIKLLDTRIGERFVIAGLAVVLALYSAYAILQFGIASIDGITYFLVDDLHLNSGT